MLVDTHCHLDAAEFGGKQTDIVLDARAAGVHCVVIPSVSRSNFDTVRSLCKQFPDCSPAYGIHPMYTGDAHPDDLAVLREYLSLPGTVAVGEIGLDFFIPHYDQVCQEHFFVEQLKLAREFNLPVLLHIRRAQDTILKHLRHFYGRGGPTSTSSGQASTELRTGIAHAFNGSRQQADEFIKLGFKLGFGGAMTYSRATRLRELAATLPLESIVLETDAPDIPPNFLERGLPNGQARLPHPNPPPAGEGTSESLREKPLNEPKYLPRIAQTLAELRGMPLEEIARTTTGNVLSVLPKLGPAITMLKLA